jgi:hypothetical protein
LSVAGSTVVANPKSDPFFTVDSEVTGNCVYYPATPVGSFTDVGKRKYPGAIVSAYAKSEATGVELFFNGNGDRK